MLIRKYEIYIRIYIKNIMFKITVHITNKLWFNLYVTNDCVKLCDVTKFL